MMMPYATAYDLLTLACKMEKAEAEKAAALIALINPPHATPDEPDPMLGFVADFAALYKQHPNAAMKLLENAVKANQGSWE